MRAAICRAYGEPESVTVEDVPSLEPSAGEVVVRVEAAAVNFPDVLLVADRYQVSAPLPFTPGSEVAGEIIAVGEGVDGWATGQRVFGTAMVGAFAEEMTLPAATLTAVPDGVDARSAAAFPVVYTTAYHALRSVGRVQPGEWVAVLGAAGGVGLATVEIAVALGARVAAVASTAEKRAVCLEHGASAVVDPASDVRDGLREATGGAGVDVIIDPVGGPLAERALRAGRRGGRFVTVGFASGEIPRIPLNLVLLKGVTIVGFEMRTFAEDAPEEAERNRRELMELLAAGKLHPHIGAVFPLDEAAAALRHVADRKAIGKVIVEP
jgi:NADPH2:quinone reductase